ncbi:MAG: hypothetical protein HPKKFMNG_02367 [Planctomycetes bacterium]|nr:hypothetical protein [Planctomycetota bacterium]
MRTTSPSSTSTFLPALRRASSTTWAMVVFPLPDSPVNQMVQAFSAMVVPLNEGERVRRGTSVVKGSAPRRPCLGTVTLLRVASNALGGTPTATSSKTDARSRQQPCSPIDVPDADGFPAANPAPARTHRCAEREWAYARSETTTPPPGQEFSRSPAVERAVPELRVRLTCIGTTDDHRC